MIKTLAYKSTLLFGFLLIIFACFTYHQLFSTLTLSNEIIFVPKKTTFEVLKDTLKSNNLLKNEYFFDLFCSKKKFNKIHPGRYEITANMNTNSMINMLRLGAQKPLNIIFNNTSTIYDLAHKISLQIDADSTSLIMAFTDRDFYLNNNLDEASIRKLFIPNTYQVYWTISPKDFLDRMYREYQAFWSEERLQKAQKIGLNPHEVSVLASIVQKESAKVDEQPIVAGLYLNRLRQNMKLQSDPTVIYAMKEKEGFDLVVKRVLRKDLKIESLYNTYLHKGLPPNPICIPEMSAILSVLNYSKHNYIYMCAKEDFSGYHNFTKSWTEHKRNAKLFQNALSLKGVMR